MSFQKVDSRNDNPVVVYATAVEEQQGLEPSAPPPQANAVTMATSETLHDMVTFLQQQLGLSQGGNMADVVDNACRELRIPMEGGLLDRAAGCCRILRGGPTSSASSSEPAQGAADSSPAPSVVEVEQILMNTDWSGGKPGGGGENYHKNPWIFRTDHTFVTLRDGCHGTWSVRANSSSPGGLVLRMDWHGEQISNWAEFALQAGSSDTQFRATGSSYTFMRSWNIIKRGPTRPNGEWTNQSPKIPAQDIAGCWGCVCFPLGWAIESKTAQGEDGLVHSGLAGILCVIPCPYSEPWTRIPNTNVFQKNGKSDTLHYLTSCFAMVESLPILACKICPF